MVQRGRTEKSLPSTGIPPGSKAFATQMKSQAKVEPARMSEADEGGRNVEDSELEQRIRSAFAHQPTLDASSVEVRVRSGDVALHGSVSSGQEKFDLEECVLAVRGVRGISNELEIRRDEVREREGHIKAGTPL